MGDFTGFTFGDWRSSDLESGLVTIFRVSSGDRYEEQLQPEIKDVVAEIPGMDGEYYFGSTYGTKSIEIDIAFDNLTEQQFRELRKVFSTRKIKRLIFDERPYKYYMAKIESPIELSYVCFDEPRRSQDTPRNGIRRDRENDTEENVNFSESIDVLAGETVTYELQHVPVDDSLEVEGMEYEMEGNVLTFVNETEEDIEVTISYTYVDFVPAWEEIIPWKYTEGTQRIYKGEGKISFKCSFPFAKSVYKQIPDGEEESDWAISSGILSADEYENENIDSYNSETNIINIYNAGDIETGFRLYIPSTALSNTITLNYKEDGDSITASLVINSITLQENSNNTTDIGVLVDTTNELIIGVSQINTTTLDGVTYNTYITSDNIYNDCIESGYFFHFEPNAAADESILQIVNGAAGIEIFYDYLYF